MIKTREKFVIRQILLKTKSKSVFVFESDSEQLSLDLMMLLRVSVVLQTFPSFLLSATQILERLLLSSDHIFVAILAIKSISQHT